MGSVEVFLGQKELDMEVKVFDVIILGAGPAGLQAAIHSAGRKARVLVLGKQKKSSMWKAHVENYLFLNDVVTGEELLAAGKRQAEKFGAEFLEEDVIEVERRENTFKIVTEDSRQLSAPAIIIATGISRKKSGIEREREFVGRGVSYCVDCDARFYKNATVAVAGNGSAAASGALLMLMYAQKVYLISKRLDISEHLKNQVAESAAEHLDGRWIKEIKGENQVEALMLDDGRELKVDGIFIELGAKGSLELVANLGVKLDSSFKFIQTNEKQQTNVAGIYAAGDICGPPWQIAKAVGEGCVAGIEAARYVGKIVPLDVSLEVSQKWG
jgi:thioredoxin reductase (NADPH)